MGHCGLDRLAFRVLGVLAAWLILATVWAPMSSAGPIPICASANLSTLMGATCDISSLQFTFSSLNSFNTNGPTWTASDFRFTPVSNGFSLTFIPGAQAITAPANGSDYVDLFYAVSNLSGNFIGESVTGGVLSGSTNGSGSQTALYEGITISTAFTSAVLGYNQVVNGISSSSQNNLAGVPFPDGALGIAIPFYLDASNGGSSSWDGTTTTFTYNTVPVSTTPEPASLLLFGTALLAVVLITQRKLAH
jgi:PEP-CTERM motif